MLIPLRLHDKSRMFFFLVFAGVWLSLEDFSGNIRYYASFALNHGSFTSYVQKGVDIAGIFSCYFVHDSSHIMLGCHIQDHSFPSLPPSLLLSLTCYSFLPQPSLTFWGKSVRDEKGGHNEVSDKKRLRKGKRLKSKEIESIAWKAT